MKKFMFILLFLIINSFLLTACAADILDTNANVLSAVTTESSLSGSFSLNNTQTNQTATGNSSKNADNAAASNSDEKEITQKTKDYIINGQKDKTEAEKLKWSEAFLNQVNMETVYQKYISAGGKADSIESFAEYLTQNAPIPSNWKELFRADLLDKYGVKASQYKPLQNDLYQVYTKIDDSDVPYVVVNARTGYFHG